METTGSREYNSHTGIESPERKCPVKKSYSPFHPSSLDLLLLMIPSNETQEAAVVRLKSLNRLYSRLLKDEIDTTLVRNASALIRKTWITGEKGYQKTTKTSPISTKALIKNAPGTWIKILTNLE